MSESIDYELVMLKCVIGDDIITERLLVYLYSRAYCPKPKPFFAIRRFLQYGKLVNESLPDLLKQCGVYFSKPMAITIQELVNAKINFGTCTAEELLNIRNMKWRAVKRFLDARFIASSSPDLAT